MTTLNFILAISLGLLIIGILFWLTEGRFWWNNKEVEWTFFKEYRSYNKSLWDYVMYVSRSDVESFIFSSELNNGKKIIYGGFIVMYSSTHSKINNMVFLNIFRTSGEFMSTLKTVLGKVEDNIYLRHPDTVIHVLVPIESKETIEALTALGYIISRTYYLSDQKVELVKSKIMNN
ncbi:MAG: hypothetical protein ACP5OA_03480 [Candidatus Woesearchaeota archaeon]